MINPFENLQPNAVWKHFYSLTQIPRPSKHEKEVVDFVVKFAKEKGLEVIIDKVGNVIIRKSATPGMENRMGIILQGHLDMVPQKNSDKVHNFEEDPIEAYIDGEWITANGTTLGADNGIGVAAAMAVLEDKTLVHGPIEALFTIDEETGMTGAFGLEPATLKGDILINLDSEDEGELYVGCAGGLDANIQLNYSPQKAHTDFDYIKISVTGLKGGHSGMDISSGRANAIKLLFRFLIGLESKCNFSLASLDGGSLRNAIPREAFAVIGVDSNNYNEVQKLLNEYLNVYKSEFSKVEPDLKMAVEKVSAPSTIIDTKSQWAIIRAVFGCPNGVVRMSDSMPGLVETSTNFARIFTKDDKILAQCLLRSSVDSAKEALAQKIAAVFQLAGADVTFTGGYPGWKPNMDSAILKTMQQVYQKNFGKIPEIKAIHAGLECGIIGGVYPNLDMISFGPTIRYPHSPDEKVKIDTVDMFWRFLVEVLKDVPRK